MSLLSASRNNPVRKRIRYGFVGALMLIMTGFGLTLYSYNQSGKNGELVQHTQRVFSQMNTVQMLLVDMETGVRGYVASRDTLFLEPYYAALPRISKEIEALRLLVSERHMLSYVDSLDRLAAGKIALAQRQIQAVQTEGRAGSDAPYMRLGKVKIDNIRALLNTMYEEERQLLNRQVQLTNRSFRNTIIIVFMLSMLTLISLVIIYNLLENELSTRQKTEAQLRAYEADLKNKIRMLEVSNEELERFAFVASHDMQEPLRKVQSFGFLLQEQYQSALGAEGSMYLSKIVQSAERMSRLIKDLLNFSRVANENRAFEPVRLSEVVSTVLDDLELKIKTLDADIQVGRLPVIDAVPSQMDHLFTNLLSNALKFASPDRRLRIRVHAQAVDGYNYTELISGKKYYKLTVEDNGIGFEEKYVSHIFKIFKRLHAGNVYEGTGIGLAICKRIVSYHNGHITATSQPGIGTTFIIILPQEQTPAKNDVTTNAETHSYSISRR